MYNFDSLTLKFFTAENESFLKGASLQKIQQPSRRELVFSLRNSGENRKFYINIDPKYPHLCFVDDYSRRGIKIPQHPPMFCMQLRKYLDGARVLDVKHVEYERILELYFNHSDEIGSLTSLCLSIELMGKHSNVILYNANSKVILGCMHNISSEKSSVREVFGGVNYIYPPKQNKTDILKTSYGAFCEVLKEQDNPIKAINDHYYYLSMPLIKECTKTSVRQDLVLETTDTGKPVAAFDEDGGQGETVVEQCKSSFECLQKLVSGKDKTPLYNILGDSGNINSLINKHFENEMFKDIFARKSSQLKRQVNKELKRLQGVVRSKQDDGKALSYKEKGDVIFQKAGQLSQEEIEEAQKYYVLYKKAKNAQKVHSEMLLAAQEDIKYYEAVLFDIENSKTLEELDEITLGETEPSAKVQKLEIQKETFGEWEIFLGKNNKQNDYLISKVARGEDFWFHAKDFPSSHVILKPLGALKVPPDEVLLRACEIVKENSPLSGALKASVIYTKRKYLRKPPGAKLGYVTYREEKEIVV